MEMTAENWANDTRQTASEQSYVGKSLTTGSPGKINKSGSFANSLMTMVRRPQKESQQLTAIR